MPETITAPRTDAAYNCHAYLTKVPIAAIQPFIETFTKSGDVVADIFAGSGMTGLAAAVLGRKARLSDISVLGQHIAGGYLATVDPDRLRKTADRAMNQARRALGGLYQTLRALDRQPVEIVRTVWSFTYLCLSCQAELIYFERMRNNRTAPPDKCAHCEGPFVRRKWPRGKDVPVQVVVRDLAGRLVEQAVETSDLSAIAAAERDPRQAEVPSQTIDPSREMYSRSGLGKAGLTETGKFFSPRNAIALLELWRAISAVEDRNLHKKLTFAFTAILPRASRRYQWSAQRPLNAQNQTYYIAPVYYEWNVFELFERKVEAAIRADGELFGQAPLFASAHEVSYELASADRLQHLADESIDYVFTDPPFGSNIFYSDMNLFHETWLGKITEHSREAVMHTTGRKKDGAARRYEQLLAGAFAEAYRVLKPGRHMSVVFGNSDGQIWGLVQRAIRQAGFDSVPSHIAILDKGQRSVKGLNSGSEGVVTVDLIMTLQKPTSPASTASCPKPEKANARELIAQVFRALPDELARSASLAYAAVVREAIRRHQLVDDLHLSDVLIALRNAGYSLDRKSGVLRKPERASTVTAE